MERASRAQVWGAMLLISLGWGTNGVVVRVAFDAGMEPLAVVAISSVIAAVGVVAFVTLSGRDRTIGAIGWRVGIVMSITSVTVPFITRNLALQYASAGFVGLASALVPLATGVVAHIMLPEERLQAATLIGLLISLAGVAVLILSGDSGLAEGGNPALAGILALAGVLSVAVGAVYAKRYSGRYSPLGVSGVQFVIGAAIGIVAMLAFEGVPANPGAKGWASLAYVGLAATFLPITLYYWLLRHVTVTFSAITGYIIPLVAVVFGVIVLGERVDLGIVLGGALILAGVVVTDRIAGR